MLGSAFYLPRNTATETDTGVSITGQQLARVPLRNKDGEKKVISRFATRSLQAQLQESHSLASTGRVRDSTQKAKAAWAMPHSFGKDRRVMWLGAMRAEDGRKGSQPCRMEMESLFQRGQKIRLWTF